MTMNNKKMAMCIGKATNRTTCTEAAAHQSYARTRFLLFDFEISFRLTSAALLLNWMMAVICQSYSITNGTVSNKIANIWSICGPVFKTFISIITKYELITIFEA